MRIRTLRDVAQVDRSGAEEDLVLHARVRLRPVRERRDARLVVGARALVVDRHRSIALEVRDGDDGRVHGELAVVDAEAMPVRVGVREQARLEDRVRGGLDAGHGV